MQINQSICGRFSFLVMSKSKTIINKISNLMHPELICLNLRLIKSLNNHVIMYEEKFLGWGASQPAASQRPASLQPPNLTVEEKCVVFFDSLQFVALWMSMNLETPSHQGRNRPCHWRQLGLSAGPFHESERPLNGAQYWVDVQFSSIFPHITGKGQGNIQLA